MGRQVWFDIYEELAGQNAISRINDPWLFPNLISDETCQKAPPAVILTSEYDLLRKSAEQATRVYRRNKNLLAYGNFRGAHHSFQYDFKHERTDAWFNTIKALTDKYL